MNLLGPLPTWNVPTDWWELIEQTLPNYRSLSTLWWAVEAGSVVAVSGLDPTTGWCGPTFVREPYRGRGLQKLLLRAKVQWASIEGLQWLQTAVDLDNPTSLRNCLRVGFEPKSYRAESDDLYLTWRKFRGS